MKILCYVPVFFSSLNLQCSQRPVVTVRVDGLSWFQKIQEVHSFSIPKNSSRYFYNRWLHSHIADSPEMHHPSPHYCYIHWLFSINIQQVLTTINRHNFSWFINWYHITIIYALFIVVRNRWKLTQQLNELSLVINGSLLNNPYICKIKPETQDK